MSGVVSFLTPSTWCRTTSRPTLGLGPRADGPAARLLGGGGGAGGHCLLGGRAGGGGQQAASRPRPPSQPPRGGTLSPPMQDPGAEVYDLTADELDEAERDFYPEVVFGSTALAQMCDSLSNVV